MARRLLSELTSDIALDNTSFPFMSVREGHVAGIPARVFRISFTGDLSFEVNVPASYGHALWIALMAAGEKYQVTPYGTETMHVLRAEKGFIIVGQETDGAITPQDLGMSWVVSKQKVDFFGKRSFARPVAGRAQADAADADSAAEARPDSRAVFKTGASAGSLRAGPPVARPHAGTQARVGGTEISAANCGSAETSSTDGETCSDTNQARRTSSGSEDASGQADGS